jgi:hypothetical protein
VGEKRNSLRLKSVASLTALEKIEPRLEEMGFKDIAQTTIVSNAKFWIRKLYKRKEETITISNEIGEALHLRDPVITLCAHRDTIAKVRRAL